MDAGHEFRCINKRYGHNAHGRGPVSLSDDCVVQTARRTAPSVPDSAKDSIPTHSFAHQFVLGRSAVIRFYSTHDVGNFVFVAEDGFDSIEKR